MNDLMGLHSSLDRLFTDMVGDPMFGSRGGRPAGVPTFHLPVDVIETENGYGIRAPVPGFSPEEVEVTFADGILSISAKHQEEKTEEEGDYVRRETAFGNYVRQVSLPGDIKEEDIKASFENGVLTVEVPRAPRPQPARIEVQHSGESSSRRKIGTGSGSGNKSN
ncbi:MAG TPA: Hsp20/alpha crystallin family protein [Candidatus Dormibacteraeota bacterium]|jgi:HSP20 family protein|nr:Hsp20/alpha crystallin family protein [Candidatus Dormibacteraeota bacterium]